MNSSAVMTVVSRENTLAAAAMSGKVAVLPAARTEAVGMGRAIATCRYDLLNSG